MTSGQLYDLILTARARGYKYQEIADITGIPKGTLVWIKQHKIVHNNVIESIKNTPYSDTWFNDKFPLKNKKTKLNAPLLHAIGLSVFSSDADLDVIIGYYLANPPTARQLIYWNYLLKRKIMYYYEGDVSNKRPGWLLLLRQYFEKKKAYGGIPKKIPTQINEVIEESDLFRKFVRKTEDNKPGTKKG